MKFSVFFSLVLVLQCLPTECRSKSFKKGVAEALNTLRSEKSAGIEDGHKLSTLAVRTERNTHPKRNISTKKQHITTPPTAVNFTNQSHPSPIVAPFNRTELWKQKRLERLSRSAVYCVSFIIILLFGCVFWSGMLKQKHPYMYPAQDGSYQSVEMNSHHYVNIKELLQSKLRSLNKYRTRRKRKRKAPAKGPTYLELKQQEMSSTSEEDFFNVT